MQRTKMKKNKVFAYGDSFENGRPRIPRKNKDPKVSIPSRISGRSVCCSGRNRNYVSVPNGPNTRIYDSKFLDHRTYLTAGIPNLLHQQRGGNSSERHRVRMQVSRPNRVVPLFHSHENLCQKDEDDSSQAFSDVVELRSEVMCPDLIFGISTN